MNKENRYLLFIVTDLGKIHDHMVKEDKFSAGFELGALINRIVNYINDETRKEDEDEEVQEEECDEECEQGPEEEGGSEDSYFLEFQREKTARILPEERLEEANQKIMKLEGTANTLCHTKRCIFELQDLLMRLIKYRKINLEEVENVINILRNTGIEKGDIDVICKGIIR
jgi:hypothetical protein